jgi:nucleotide-binding universal stress UspA family protein
MKILVPVDGSKYSYEALKVAVDYAKMKSADMTVISVASFAGDIDLEISAAEREKIIKRMEDRADSLVLDAHAALSKENVSAVCKIVTTDSSIAEAIIDSAEEEKADLVIMGSRGLSPATRFKMGSVAVQVVKYSPCSVQVVKIPE